MCLGFLHIITQNIMEVVMMMMILEVVVVIILSEIYKRKRYEWKNF